MRGTRAARTRSAGIALGLGLGGLLSGIVHPVASWLMLLAWLAALAGIFMLWSALRGPGPLPSPGRFAGSLLVGWGAFNFAEGAVYHHVLELHHVRALQPVYDWAFLLVGGVGVLLLGLALRERARETPFERRSGYDRRAAGPPTVP